MMFLLLSFVLQLFDKKFVDAVLQEWYKTMVNLPAGLRQAYEMVIVFNFMHCKNIYQRMECWMVVTDGVECILLCFMI